MMVGERRPWFSRYVEVCDIKDFRGSKFNRVTRRMATFSDAGIPFVLMNDDFILGSDYDFDLMKWYVDGTLGKLLKKHPDKTYKRFVEQTIKRLEIPHSTPSHLVHFPMLVNKPVEVADYFRHKKLNYGVDSVSFRQTAATVLQINRNNLIEVQDCKARTPLTTKQWGEKLNDSFVSLSPQCTNEAMFLALARKFPNKSKWEK